MEEKIYSLAQKINASLKNEECFKKLDELDKELNSNEEVMALAYKKDMALLNYNDALKIYDDHNPEVIKLRKALNEAKYNLDCHPLVKEYLKTYSEVKQMLYELNHIIFDDYKFKDEMICR